MDRGRGGALTHGKRQSMCVLSIHKFACSFVQANQSLECPVAVVLLFYIHGKHQRSCRDGQLPNHTFPGQA